MKLNSILRLSLVAGIASSTVFGTTCGAEGLFSKASAKEPVFTKPEVMTPELQAADERVGLCEQQLEVAKKQLNAARSLLKAAEADLRAARADREALSLKTQAQALADEAGMIRTSLPPPTSQPKAIAAKPETNAGKTPDEQKDKSADTPIGQAPAPAPNHENANSRLQPVDFNAEPINEDGTIPIQLR